MRNFTDIKAVICDSNERQSSLLDRVKNSYRGEIQFFDNDEQLGMIIKNLRNSGILSKETLILKNFKGRYFEKCPGSPGIICCNYLLINTGFNCLYNCTYCYLQNYLNSFGILMFTNFDEILDGLKYRFNRLRKDRVWRIGTGEYTDSLMADYVTAYSEKLITLCADYKNIMLELKTKSKNADHLLDLSDKGNTVLSWSLSTERNISLYEENTASLDDRLHAAHKAGEAGYFLSFHFDPIIVYDGWQKDYSELIDRVFRQVRKESVVWISLGGFRYTPDFKDIMNRNFPDEVITAEEMFPSVDGKYRYRKKERIAMYKFMLDKLCRTGISAFIYMCMETSDVWKQVFGRDYAASHDLAREFSESMKRNFISI